jgi:hypothetical protein
MSISNRSSSIRHQNSYLMEGLGRVGPEIPLHIRIIRVRHGVSLLRMNKVRELYGIFDKEYRGIVSNHIVVSIFSVKLNSESTWVTIAVTSSTFSSNCRETQEARSFFANLIKEISFCVSIMLNEL